MNRERSKKRTGWRGLALRLLHRLALAWVTLAGVVLLAFLALALAPGNPLVGQGDDGGVVVDGPAAEVWKQQHGLNDPLPVRFARWLTEAAQGRLGHSLRTGRPVGDEIASALIPTLEINVAALTLVLSLGLPIGWCAAARLGGRWDRISEILLLALYALPAFVIALLLQRLLAVEWPILPLYGRMEPLGAGDLFDRIRHLVLPTTCLALHQLAFFARFARNSALTGWMSGHALLARASGIPGRRRFWRHAVVPAFVSMANLFGWLVPAAATGSVLVETVFSWPGIGRLYITSINSRDVPLILGLTLLAGMMTIGGSFLADLLAWLADPRLRWSAER